MATMSVASGVQSFLQDEDKRGFLLWVLSFDKNNIIGNVLKSLQAIHLELAITSSFNEVLEAFLLDTGKGVFDEKIPFLTDPTKGLYIQVKNNLDANGTRLLNQSLLQTKSDVVQFVQGKIVPKMLPNGDAPPPVAYVLPTTAEAKAAEQQEWFNDDFRDESMLTDTELKARKAADVTREMQLNLKLNRLRTYMNCFWKRLKDPEIGKLIEQNDGALFLDEKYSSRIDWFKPETLTGGLGPNTKPTFRNIAQMYRTLVKVSAPFPGESKQEYADRETPLKVFWRRFNNLYMIAKVSQSIKRSMLQEIMDFIVFTFDEFRFKKIKYLIEIPHRIIEKIESSLPTDIGTASGEASKILLGALVQNLGQCRQVLDILKDLVGPELLGVAKQSGLDIDSMNLHQLWDEKAKELEDLKKRVDAGEITPSITNENVNFIKEVLMANKTRF